MRRIVVCMVLGMVVCMVVLLGIRGPHARTFT
jgi:hypothetical protein